ncbi:MAG: iron-siderophore ABC transporter substrate-binding protein [Rubrobacter sp.]|nr:iron-siderophore ABC transporter substrate-binding protein [Rubrobacter sp.]
MRIRYLGIAATIFASLSLTACGGGGGSESGDSGNGEGGGGGDTRTIEHAAGTTEIQGEPENVVVLDTGELDSAMTLGVTPVGATEVVAGEGFPDYLEGTEDIEPVGAISEANIEKIATLEPDLILSSELRDEGNYEELSEIAPTVFTESTGEPWRENFELHAEALGKQDEAEEVVSDYESRLEEFKNEVPEPRPEASVVRFTGPGDTRIYQKESFIGTVLEQAGVPRPEPQDVDDFAIEDVSQEAIPQMDGDVIFTTFYGDEQDTDASDFTSDELWQELDAVQNDRVYEVSDDLWMLGIGYTAANGVLDDLEQYIPEDGAETTSEG